MPVEEALAAEIESAVESQAVELEKTSTETISTTKEKVDTETKEVKEIVGEETEEKEETGETTEAKGETEGAEETRETEEAEGTEEQEGTGISDYVLQKAVLAGLPLDDARAFPNEDALLRVVASMDTMRAQEEENTKAAVASAVQGATLKTEAKDIFADLPKLDSENAEPEVVKTLNAFKEMAIKQQEEITELKAQQQIAVTVSQQSNVQEVEQWFDKEVESLGENFSEALGSGRRVDLTPGSSQFAKRDEIAQHMAVLLAGHQAMGTAPPPREAVFQAAARVVLKDEYAQLGGKKIATKLKKQAGQHISRSSGQKSTTSQSADEETAAILDRKFSTGK